MHAAEWLDPTFLIRTFSYLGLLFVVFAETGLLMGFFLPGDSLLLTAGIFAARGDLALAAVCGVCFVGAVLGNTVGYLIGRRFGPRVFSNPRSRFLKPEYVEQAGAYFERYGVRTLLISRFVPIVRTFVPTMAGAGRMDFRTFTLYNVVGALLWAVGVPLLGYFLGQIIPAKVLDKYVLAIIAVVLVASFVPIGLEVLKRRRVRA
ncbi:DedA family protein [Deinococcus pimensis]|uniref:DedA family protein n=1 Tax=Deinococcus pimensis TaxID=309888 RepID=UPI0004872AEA|nr:DedA family protein [Deinococcus pimensis]